MVYDGAGSKAGSLRAAFELIAALCIRLGCWVEMGLARKSIGNQRWLLCRERGCLAIRKPHHYAAISINQRFCRMGKNPLFDKKFGDCRNRFFR